MILRRYFSGAVREAIAMRKHVQRLLDAQRDVLSAQAIVAVEEKLRDLEAAVKAGDNDGAIRNKTEELQFAGEKWLKPYPNAVWRENIEVLLVAIAVAMAIRTFFLQPFKIPTGSMQPTLYGITSTPDFTPLSMVYQNLGGLGGLTDEQKGRFEAAAKIQEKAQSSIEIPGGWERFKDWVHGVSYLHWVAPEDGTVDAISNPWPGTIFGLFQRIEFAGKWHTIFFPPDCGEEPLGNRAGLPLNPARVFHKGEDVIKLKIEAGDHLFVDRVTYNFRAPKRGEVVVFQTAGISRLDPSQQTTFYIKRLVGLPGDHLALKQDYVVLNSQFGAPVAVGQLVVNGTEITTNDLHFARLYSFSDPPQGATTLEYKDNTYLGHAMLQSLSPGEEVDVEPHHLFVMGDNTFNSSDSRYWGDFPTTNVIGRSFFVYWPLSKRWGLDDQ